MKEYNILLLIFSFVCLCFGIYINGLYLKNKKKMNYIVFWWQASYIILIFIPVVILYFGGSLYQDINDETLMMVNMPIVFIPLANIITSNLLGNVDFKFNNFDECNKMERLAYILIGSTIIAIMVFIMVVSPVKPLIMALKNADFMQLVQSRQEGNSNVGYLTFWIRQAFSPILIGASFLRFKSTRTSSSKIIFLICLILGLIFGAFNLVKSPVVVVILVIYLTYVLTYKKETEKSNSLMFFSTVTLLLMLLVVIGLLYLQTTDRDFIGTIEAILSRVFVMPSSIMNMYVILFKDFKLSGQSINLISALTGGPTLNLSNYVFRQLYDISVIQDGTAPAPFIGEMYANFGIWGVIISSILIGQIMAIVTTVFCKLPKNYFNIAAYALLMYTFFEINRTNFTTVLLSYGVIPVTLLCALIYMLFGKRDRIKV